MTRNHPARRTHPQPGRLVTAALTTLLLVAVAPAGAGAQSLDRARQLYEGGRHAQAKAELQALQRTGARRADAAFYLGRIAYDQGDHEEAMRLFEQAVEGADGNAVYHLWLGTAAAQVAPWVGRLRQLTLAPRAKREWERAVQLDPDLVAARFHMVEFYLIMPGALGGGVARAREQARELERRSALRGALARGAIANSERNPAAAEAAYRQAISAAPDSLAGYVELAEHYQRASRSGDAFTTLEAYAARRPNDRWLQYQVGRMAALADQQHDRGERALAQFLAQPPADAHAAGISRAHYWLGQIAEKRGNGPGARTHYRDALRANPKNPLAQKALRDLR
jgi:tetratricopeptide (TPR) repeat protein